MTTRTAVLLCLVLSLFGLAAVPPTWLASEARVHDHKRDAFLGTSFLLPKTPLTGGFDCVEQFDRDGDSLGYGLAADLLQCDGIDLLSYIPTETVAGDTTLVDRNPLDTMESTDMWGWTDPETGTEWVLLGKANGIAFLDISDPTNPVHVASVDNTSAVQLLWHDVKVHDDVAYWVSESNGHGMQWLDLTALRDIAEADMPAQLLPDGVYPLTNAAHNLAINEDTGFAYIVGGNSGLAAQDQCRSGLHMVDLNTPVPTFAGCYLLDGGPGTAARLAGAPAPTVQGVRTAGAYVHDAQCVTYDGPDEDYEGREICVMYSEDRIVIADVTLKAAPTTVASFTYEHATYTHQGWFTEDQRYILANDELDEDDNSNVTNTRTIIVDLEDLDAPGEPMIFEHAHTSIDHNLYTHEGAVYQSHYSKGLRVSDLDRVGEGLLDEVAYIDVHPDDDMQGDTPAPTFNGTWSNYPYFESGVIAVSGYEGLWLVQLHEDVLDEIED